MLPNDEITVVLTGSSGYLGKQVLTALKAQGIRAVEVDKYNKLNPVDLSDTTQLDQLALPDNYFLIHLAFPLPGSYKTDDFQSLIKSINTNMAQKFEPKRTLFISSTAVYPLHSGSQSTPKPWEIYGALKFETENFFVREFPHLTIFRPGTLVESTRASSMMDFIRKLMKSRLVLIPGNGHMVHPFTFTPDLVKAIVRWVIDLDAPEGTFDLTARNPISYNQLCNLARKDKWFFKLRLPEFIFSHVGSDRLLVKNISKWHFRALYYNYQQPDINTYQANFKSYNDIFSV